MLKLTVEIEQEEDGRWIADVVDLPGVMVYGSSPQQARTAAKALAFRVLSDRSARCGE
jgi:predicted RNase H-like HicB family nuclease